jgi:ABC-2 type transport system permease protein
VRTLRLIFSLISFNYRTLFAQRGTLFVQALFMMLNNLIFFALWLIIFGEVGEIGGWTIKEMALLHGVSALGFGISVIVAHGTLNIARTVAEGRLDSYLVLPAHPLLLVSLSRTDLSGWGDIATGVILIQWSGYAASVGLWPIFTASICGAILLAAVVIVAQSTAFWCGQAESLARTIFFSYITVKSYPSTIFYGFLKVVLFTVLPAGFATYLPVSAIIERQWSMLFVSLCAAVFYLLLACLIFERGTKRYASGSVFTLVE